MKKITYVLAVLFTSLGLAMMGIGNNVHAAASHAHVNIQNFAFSPATISVQKGTTVTWTNHDSTAHTVTGNSSGGPSSGHIQPGKSYSFTFNSVGTFPYHCAIHPDMTGGVKVTGGTAASSTTTHTTTPSKPTNATHSMTMSSMPPSNESSEYQKQSTQLPDTGASKTVPLFILTSITGTIIYYINLILKNINH